MEKVPEPVKTSLEALLREMLKRVGGSPSVLDAHMAIFREEFPRSPPVMGLLNAVTENVGADVVPTGDGTSTSLHLFLLSPLLRRYLNLYGQFDYDQPTVDRLAEEFMAAVSEESTPVSLIAPLFHVECELDHVDVSEDGVTIEPLSLPERQRLVEACGGNLPDAEAVRVTHGVRVVDRFAARWDMPALYTKTRAVASVLRLMQPSTATVSSAWLEPQRFAFGLASSTMSTRPFNPVPPFPDYATVSASDVSQLQDVYALYLSAVESDRQLAVALRRYDLAIDRVDAEDRVVDLWIAIESVLAADARTELSYRASLRLAHAIGESREAKEQIFRAARASYETRSSIVHGSDIRGDAVSVARELAEMTRILLGKWVDPKSRLSLASLDSAALG